MSRANRVRVLSATLTQSLGLTSGRRRRLRLCWTLALACGHTGVRDAVFAKTGTKRALSGHSSAEIAAPPKHISCPTCKNSESAESDIQIERGEQP